MSQTCGTFATRSISAILSFEASRKCTCPAVRRVFVVVSRTMAIMSVSSPFPAAQPSTTPLIQGFQDRLCPTLPSSLTVILGNREINAYFFCSPTAGSGLFQVGASEQGGLFNLWVDRSHNPSLPRLRGPPTIRCDGPLLSDEDLVTTDHEMGPRLGGRNSTAVQEIEFLRARPDQKKFSLLVQGEDQCV